MKKYNKLVRDKIPDIIKEKGEIPLTHMADDEEYWVKLKEKLLEETKEFIEDDNEEELADIFEVIDAICDFKKFDKAHLKLVQNKKAKERGGFGKKIILDKVKE